MSVIGAGHGWSLLSSHGHVLVEIARDPGVRIRDIALAAGVTERTVHAIVADLLAAGYLSRERVGRRSQYTVSSDALFRHSQQRGLRVGPFLEFLTSQPSAGAMMTAPLLP